MKLPRNLIVISLMTSLLLPACASATSEGGAPTLDDSATSSVELATIAAPPTEMGAWKTYHSEQAGYSVEHPADWKVDEQLGTDGSIVTTFSPPDGSAGIMIMVQSGEFGSTGSSDVPNTRCEEISIGGMTGTRCFDTLSFSVSTTLVDQGKTYIIASTGKRLDLTVYDHFLATFRTR